MWVYRLEDGPNLEHLPAWAADVELGLNADVFYTVVSVQPGCAGSGVHAGTLGGRGPGQHGVYVSAIMHQEQSVSCAFRH